MATSLFDRCGGFSTIRAVVSDFYDRVTDSENLSHYFIDMDMPSMIDHQTKFIATVMDGPASYTNEVLQRVHSHLRIKKSEFRELEEILTETLEDHDFSNDDIAYIANAFHSREHLIVAQVE